MEHGYDLYPLGHGFAYLTAVMDWHSRYVIAWRLSNTLTADFCLEALKDALQYGKPEVFNTDQGCRLTSAEFIKVLEDAGVAISMDGKGRAIDNIFVERLWRTGPNMMIFTSRATRRSQRPMLA